MIFTYSSSPVYIEADRFDKDFAVADRKVREVDVEKKHSTFDKLR
jgi:hypothetical protein